MTQTPSFGVEDIDPDKAREYLALNAHNRNLRTRVVRTYAADMLAGEWEWNGEAIKFAADGSLLDGQHRLAAIIESGVTVPMLIVRGLPSAAQETMDTGVARKFADVLKLRGESSYVTLASVCRSITAWDSGSKRVGRGISRGYSNRELLRTLEKYPWIREGVPTVRRAQAEAALPAAVGGLTWWLFTQLDSEDAEHFFTRLSSAEGHRAGDPIFTLRSMLLASSSVKGERNSAYLLAVTIKAWNKYRAGEDCPRLSFRLGGSKPETFPEPK